MFSPRSSVALATAAILGFAVFASTPAVSAQQGGYRVLKQTTLGGEGTWDYVVVDPDAKRVYIPRATHVMVVDETTHKIVGDIPGLKGIHGVALATEFNRGFITGNSPKGVITVFDLKTLQVTASIQTMEEDCDGILYDPATKRVFVNNGDGESVTVIDAASAKVVGTVKLPDGPEAAASDGRGSIFVDLADKGAVLQYDAKSLAIKNTWPAAPCQRAYGMALDVAHQRVFVTCQGTKPVLVVLNAESGKVVASMPIGGGSDGVAYDPGTGDVFVTCRDGGDGQGVVHVFHQESPDKYTKLADVKYMYGARTVALDPKTHHIFSIGAAQNDPVAPTPQNANPRPRPVLSTFSLVEVGR